MEDNTNTNTSANQNGNTGNGNGYSNPNNGNSNPTDFDGNEITRTGKFFAGLSLIVITFLSALYLIAHWPDRLVTPGEHIKPLYIYKWFHVRLAGIPDTGTVAYMYDSIRIVEKSSFVQPDIIKPDSIKPAQPLKDSLKHDSAEKVNKPIKADLSSKLPPVSVIKFPPESELLHINTLLLILVAVAGFLGNMIHIASSFTDFIGNGRFRRRWTLFYIVKPFTAAALAIAIYFVFRGGFLNMSDESTNINLYGLMTISILAGLFTDRTALKLKEVFDVLLKPKEERANPLADGKPQIISIDAPPLESGKAVTVNIHGKDLDKQPVIIKLNGQEITNATKQPALISFNYTLPPELKDKDALSLQISDNTGKTIFPAKDLIIKKEATARAGSMDENQSESGDRDGRNNTV
jgi:hypothetical protein